MILKRKAGRYLKHNKYMFLLIFTFLCAGVIAGSFGAMRAENTVNIQKIDADNNKIILSSFLENIKYLTWILLWGLNAVGFPVIIYLLYQKGAYIAASIYSIIALEGTNKFVAVFSMIPFIVCTVSAVVCISQASIANSLSMFQRTILKKTQQKGSLDILKLVLYFMLSILLTLLGGMAEILIKVNIT